MNTIVGKKYCLKNALESPCKRPDAALKLPSKRPENALKLQCNNYETALELHSNCTINGLIAVECTADRSRTAPELHRCEIKLQCKVSSHCSEIAP